MKKSIYFVIIFIFISLFIQQTSSITYYFGDPAKIQKLVLEAVESGFDEVKGTIDKQFWFMLRQAKLDVYSFRIKSDMIEYKVNYTSPQSIFVFEVHLSKFTWRAQIISNRTYKQQIVTPVVQESPKNLKTDDQNIPPKSPQPIVEDKQIAQSQKDTSSDTKTEIAKDQPTKTQFKDQKPLSQTSTKDQPKKEGGAINL